MPWPPKMPKVPPMLAEFFAELIARIDANRPIDGLGIKFSDSPSGRSGTVAPARGGGGGGDSVFPFKVLVNNFGDTVTPDWKRIVLPGILFASTDNTDRQSITAGLAASESPAAGDGAWTATADGDEIWLEITFGTWPAISAATIKSITNSDDFEGGEVQHDGGAGSPEVFTQTVARLVIAKIADDGGLFVDEQLVRNHLLLETVQQIAVDDTGAEPHTIETVYPFTK